ncbi:alpha/beta fold hydrolase [Cellulomonas fimi]|uniref:Alpha/beta fold hydrolase n=1 Tax=Cellulomonas fimi TaxID=1708 RepID=A0A7Y0QJT6_CELFI|nr:alpha/beta fold hydrolase [Cellulomonas fimi]NMR21692.1 alpha/beta fold hydrolase [Cellulomonas fimi]
MAPSSSQKSTIVRLYRQAPFLGLRVSFTVLDRVAPALGARWAERLWFRIPASATRRAPAAAPGRRSGLLLHGRPVMWESWGEGPIVYLLHGWGGRRTQLAAFVDPLVAAGFRVVAVDTPGHGDSPAGAHGPRESTVLEMADVVPALVRTLGPAHAVVAHSLGALATMVAVDAGVPVERLAFVAPMGTVEPYTRLFVRRLGAGERTRRRMVARVERRIGMRVGFFDIAALGERLGTRPALLLVHDRADRETRWSDSETIAASWPGARLVTTEGLGHGRILADAGVVAHVVAFVAGADADTGADADPRAEGNRPTAALVDQRR